MQITFHMRYSVKGGLNRPVTTSHIVRGESMRSLCGRKAKHWTLTDWDIAQCSKCNLMIKELNYGKAAAR